MESLGRIAAGMAHDINNLMVSVLGFASLLKAYRSPQDQEYEYLECISRSAESASDLARQLLTFARGGKSRLQRICLNDILRRWLEVFRQAQPGVQVVLDEAPDLWPIDGDPTQIAQIVLNLCQNGAEAMSGRGRLTIRTRNVEVQDSAGGRQADLAPGRYVHLRVADEGCGMDQATLERIFEPFFTTKASGRGMGLAVVHGVVSDHAGYVFAESKPGEGAVFHVYLPAAASEPDAPSAS